MNAQEIKDGLENFTGTEQYHRFGISGRIVATDGVIWLAEKAGCYWLMDIISSYQGKINKHFPKLQEFQVWHLQKNKTGSGAKVFCTDGDTEDKVISQNIKYTDFPLDEITLWVERGEFLVVMLPSEH